MAILKSIAIILSPLFFFFSISEIRPVVRGAAIPADTIKKFIVDDYPVTNDMFGRDVNGREIKVGNIRSLDKVWFFNDTLNQVLVFELYTDNHRMGTYHFYKTGVPATLIKNIEFSTPDGDTVSDERKIKNFKGFVSRAQKIAKSYFITNKGFKLGDRIDKAIKMYGKPGKVKKNNGIEEYYWEFAGDILYNGKTGLKGKPLATDSYGHQIRMFFKNKKLIGLIFLNDIP